MFTPIGNAQIVNRQGFRDTKDFATIDYLSGKTRVMMLGDSFFWLDAQDAIPAILGRKLPDCEFYNLGIPGWGLDQMYLSYKKYADLIKPQIVVLLYIDDDVPRIYEAFRSAEGMNKPDGHFSAVGTPYVAEFISKLDVFTRRRNQNRMKERQWTVGDKPSIFPAWLNHAYFSKIKAGFPTRFVHRSLRWRS